MSKKDVPSCLNPSSQLYLLSYILLLCLRLAGGSLGSSNTTKVNTAAKLPKVSLTTLSAECSRQPGEPSQCLITQPSCLSPELLCVKEKACVGPRLGRAFSSSWV